MVTARGTPSVVETEIGAQAMLGVCEDAAKPGRSETILLVEDEAFVLNATAEVLESAGYNVVIAKSANEALDIYRKTSPPIDLLLTDVVMPGMTGRDLALKFNALCPKGRVLLMSGYSDQHAVSQLYPYCKSYLDKPFSTSTLLSKVRETLDKNSFE